QSTAVSLVGDAGAVADSSLQSARPETPLNVVLLSVDSLRADIFYPTDGSTTHSLSEHIAPTLHALQRDAVVYNHAYALSSYTSMSVGGFLGGHIPSELERNGFFFGTYPRSVLMFPERLQAAGVRTMAAQAHFYFRRVYGLDQ